MKNLIFIAVAAIFAAPAMAQPVSDRGVIPVAVTLNQVLRLNITDGGNIEFVFNQIAQYTNGINSGGGNTFYQTNFTVASSTAWELNMEAEDATFIGTDDPANVLLLDNVGFQIADLGSNTLAGGELSDPATALTSVIALPGVPTPVISVGALSNAGDATIANGNVFRIDWRAGTFEGGMNATALIDQVPSPAADRYVTNVFLDLTAL